MSSAVKVSERVRGLLVSPAKKIESSDVTLARISCFLHVCVVGSWQSLSKQTNNGKKIPIIDSKEFKQQAIEFD